MLATHTQIRAFNAVAREGSFARAAARLHLTQPAVTLQVRALEETYGVVLFDRRGASVSMTDTARTLYTLTQQIQPIEEQVDELLGAQSRLMKGELTMATGSPPILMGLVREFTRRYPEIQVAVKLGNWAQVWGSINDRTADIALLTAPPSDERILSLPYSRQRVVVLAPAGHIFAKRKSVALRDLVCENLIVRDERSHTQKLVQKIFRDAKIPLNPAMTLDTREALHEAVAAGLGVGFVLSEETGVDKRVHSLEIEDSTETCLEAIVCLKGQARRRIVKAFLEVVRDMQAGEKSVCEGTD